MRETDISEELDGYKDYILDLGGNFIEFVEQFNVLLNTLEDTEFVGDLKMKARIKDFSSAKANTNKKILDDVFGIEIVTPTEFSKEFIILLNTVAFETQRNKKFNKDNGYKAYHSLISLKQIPNLEEINLEKVINNTVVKEYRKAIIEFEDTEPLYMEKKLFPELIEYIKVPENKEKITQVINILLKSIQEYSSSIDINKTPLVEFQYKTAEVAENAIRGKANHYEYKNVPKDKIIEKFNNGQLIRGLNAPWRFERVGRKIQSERFRDTLVNNWPFLSEYISTNLNNTTIIDDGRNKIKRAFITVFPFFAPYVLPDDKCRKIKKIRESKREAIWQKLKMYTIADISGFSNNVEELINAFKKGENLYNER